MLLKVLNEDGSTCHGGKAQWSLPVKNGDGTWTPGEWMPAIEGALVPCRNGYHLCRAQDLLSWLGPAIFEAEYRGEMVESTDKIAVREARLLRQFENWNARTARLLACEYAERVLPLFERVYPEDGAPRHAIETSRRCAIGDATDEELDAAWTAARDAADTAASATAWAAARAAASAAARAAAWTAEREWQIGRLREYLEGRV